VLLALVVTHDGFSLWHEVFAGNTNDAAAFPQIITTMEQRFGAARRVWVLDRGIASDANLAFLRERKQSYLVGTPRSRLSGFEAELCTRAWTAVRGQVEVRTVSRDGQTYVLARSAQRRLKERAIRRRQLLGLYRNLKTLAATVATGRLKQADRVLERVGRLRERWPAAGRFAAITLQRDEAGQAQRVRCSWHKDKLKAALARDGAYLLLSDQTDWSAAQLWATYMQLTRAEEAFRTMKSQQLLRPIWHHDDERVRAHVFVCVLAYALWKALEHMLHNAGLRTLIRKQDPSQPQVDRPDRPMSPAVALRILHDVPIGDILLETLDGHTLRLRRVARPNPEQAELLAALKLTLPERLCADAGATSPRSLGLPTEGQPAEM